MTKCQACRLAVDRVTPVYRRHRDEWTFDLDGAPMFGHPDRPAAIAARRAMLVALACDYRGTQWPATLGSKKWQDYVR